MGVNASKDEETLEELGSDGTGTGLEAERLDMDGSIKAPFNPAEIDVITQARTVDLLLTRLRERELDLSPDFQRRGNLWTDKRKSGLIESMILRIPIPSLYVSEDAEGSYTVVDGLQRMCAIAHFANVDALNKSVRSSLNPLRLSGLQSLPNEFIGRSFSELPRNLQRRISETELTLHIIRPSTPLAVKFNIFSRINQGGLPLASQEIRNAIFPGNWRARVRTMAEGDTFAVATERKIRGERMEDLELVLRFCAHYALADREQRPEKQNLDDFLNDFVQKMGRSWTDDQWSEVQAAFSRAMKYSSRVFGQFAFRKYYGDQRRRPINRGLFESTSVILAKLAPIQLDELAARQSEVLARLAELFKNDHDFANSLLYATGRGSSSNTRLNKLGALLDEVLNA